jgi:hypothetical protein
MALGCGAHEANNTIFDPFQKIFHNDLKARSKVRGTSATDSEQIFCPARSAGSADASFMHRGYDHGCKANDR